MLYKILQSFVKFGLHWYVADWQLKNLKLIDYNKPTLIVSNHPNSFFDSIIIAAFAPTEIRFLARGDAFHKPLSNWALRSFFMLPIYKKRDDPEYDVKNAFTYDECARQLNAGVKVFVFPEGISRNQIEIGPFMPSGISFIIQRAIQMDIPIQLQAYVIGYNSFNDVPKSVYLEALPGIDCTDYIQNGEVQTSSILHKLKNQIADHVPKQAIQPRSELYESRKWMKYPALLGYYTHNWYYQLVKKQVKKKTDGTIFFDSMNFGILLFSYPIIVFILSIIIGNIAGFWWGLLIFILLPALSYCWVQHQPIKVDQETPSARANSLNP